MKPEVLTHSFRRDNCRLCGASDLELVLQLAPTPPGDHYLPAERLKETQTVYPLDLFLCRACGLAQLRDVVDPDVLYGNYIYRTSISLGLTEHYQGYADEVLRRVSPPEGALVIDIGSNDGSLLNCFQNRGLRVLGVDPARELAEQATRSGIETLPTYFSMELARAVREEWGPVMIVTANNVIANIDNLDDMIGGIRSLLAPNGVFVFETGYVVDLVQQGILDNIYHEHLSYFSVKPLAGFFRKHGMELINVEHVPTKGGSLRGTVQLASSGCPASRSVNDLIAVETNRGFDCPETFKAWAARCDEMRDELVSLVHNLVARGKTVAGYGASVGVTTLIYYFDLGSALSFLVDDNSSRHGLFSPGYHIPVLSPRVIYERKPDYVLMLPWRFSEAIIKTHQTYLDQGGHFIVPLPKVDVI